jgi:hypothetical protein
MLDALGVLEILLRNFEALVDLALDDLRRVGGGFWALGRSSGLGQQGPGVVCLEAFRDQGRDVFCSAEERDVGLGNLGLTKGSNRPEKSSIVRVEG